MVRCEPKLPMFQNGRTRHREDETAASLREEISRKTAETEILNPIASRKPDGSEAILVKGIYLWEGPAALAG